MTSPQTTSTGQALPTDRAWGPWVFIPNPITGAPYKAQRTRAGLEEGTSERLTIWFSDDPRDLEPHTHPWPFTTTILPSPTGSPVGYLEEVWTFDEGRASIELYKRTAGETFEVPAGRAHHVGDVVPGTMTHMIIGKLSAGPKDWGHWTRDAVGDFYKYEPAQAAPEFLQLLKHFGTTPE